jgi:AcrR family transcriptional regulator
MSRKEVPVTKAARESSERKSSERESSPRKSTRKPDRRVRQTRDALGDALVKLMHAKPFEEITVQHILDGAGVSRSTFYTHFSDKNDLFLSDAEDFFEMMASALSEHRDKSRRLAPVREMFEHAAEWRPFLKAMTEAGKIQDVMEIGRECFARGIARRIEEMGGKEPVKDTGRKVEVRVSGAGPREPGGMPRSVATPVSQMLAGSLMGLLAWWLHAGQGLTATEMEERFHDLAWAGLGRAAG